MLSVIVFTDFDSLAMEVQCKRKKNNRLKVQQNKHVLRKFNSIVSFILI